MRAKDILYETIEVISEKTTSDELIPFLEPLGFDIQKKTGNTVKVVVPAMYRTSGVQQISSVLPGSTISSDGKKVHYDGSTILVKPSEAQGGRLEKEEGQILALDTAIKEHLKGQPFIKLAVGTRVVDAAGVAKVPGNVKADAQIIDHQGNPVAWISLKDGTTPKGFGHWGGVDHLGQHKEVAAFVNAIKATFGNEFPRGPTYGVKIKDPTLKAITCFGKNYGGAPGVSNVDLILQGHPTLKKGTRGSYVLTGAHTWYNGDIPTGEYEPALIVRFSADRGNFGIMGARISSYPTAGRPWSPLPKPKATPAVKQPMPTPPGIVNQNRTMAQGKIPMGTTVKSQGTKL
jgi:hypothetical protein